MGKAIIYLADGTEECEALLCAGSTLWMLACAWQALRADEYGKDGDE